jgi:hypothetical protein
MIEPVRGSDRYFDLYVNHLGSPLTASDWTFIILIALVSTIIGGGIALVLANTAGPLPQGYAIASDAQGSIAPCGQPSNRDMFSRSTDCVEPLTAPSAR